MRLETAQRKDSLLWPDTSFSSTVQSHGHFLVVDGPENMVHRASEGFLESRGIETDPRAPFSGVPLSRWFDDQTIAAFHTRAKNPDAPFFLDPFPVRCRQGCLFDASTVRFGTALMIELWPVDTAGPRSTPPNDATDFQALLFAMGRTNRLHNLDDLCQNATDALARLTGYDQVFLFCFNEQGDIDVFGETLAPGSPLSPIGKEKDRPSDVLFGSRAILNRMPLYGIDDVDDPLQGVLCTTTPLPKIDPGFSLLRAPPDTWSRYLRSVGVRARLRMAIVVNDRLWGGLVCHHPRPRNLSPRIMGACQIFIDVLSGRIGRLEDARSAAKRAHVAAIMDRIDAQLANGASLEDAFSGSLADMMSLFGAQGAVLSLKGRQWTQNGALMGDAITIGQNETPIVADRFEGDMQIQGALGATFAGGVLLPLSGPSDRDFILLGRSQPPQETPNQGDPFTSLDHEAARSLHIFLSRRVHEIESRPPVLGSETTMIGFPPWHESSMDWFWETDAEGRLTTVTKFFEDVEGASSQSILGHRLTDFLVIDPRAGETSEVEALHAAFHRRAAFHGLTALLQLPGFEHCWVRLSGFPMLGKGEELIGFRGAATNVTRIRALQEEKIRSQRLEALGRMASGIAHEINNVLQPMLTMSYYAAKRLDDQDFVRSALCDIEESGLRAREIVKAILAFSRQTPSDRSPLRIADELTKALSFAGKGLPRLRVKTDIEKTEAEVLANTTELSQIVLNLLTNASDAMDGRGVVTVTLRNQPDTNRVRITVRDEGPGMDLTTRNRIFDPFFTTKAPGRGTGMGLAVVHGLVEAWGGTVGLDSVPGFGTTFWISLPTIPP